MHRALQLAFVERKISPITAGAVEENKIPRPTFCNLTLVYFSTQACQLRNSRGIVSFPINFQNIKALNCDAVSLEERRLFNISQYLSTFLTNPFDFEYRPLY